MKIILKFGPECQRDMEVEIPELLPVFRAPVYDGNYPPSRKIAVYSPRAKNIDESWDYWYTHSESF